VGTVDNTNTQAQRDLLKAIFYCLLVVVVVRSFVFEPFRIPSSSMVPTLKIGDHIFVSKFSYGLSVPFTKIEFVSFRQPKRGDVIVFLWPRDESLHYVKRVIGVPGDLIEVKGRDVWINGQLAPKEKATSLPQTEDVFDKDFDEGDYFNEKLETVNHLIRHDSNKQPMGHEARPFKETVPKDHYFVMGDNRDDSSDSRSWGFVPKENVKGKAQLIWLSLDQAGAWNKLRRIRWSRCLQLIH
jgi:signal peptidase I